MQVCFICVLFKTFTVITQWSLLTRLPVTFQVRMGYIEGDAFVRSMLILKCPMFLRVIRRLNVSLVFVDRIEGLISSIIINWYSPCLMITVELSCQNYSFSSCWRGVDKGFLLLS